MDILVVQLSNALQSYRKGGSHEDLREMAITGRQGDNERQTRSKESSNSGPVL